MHVANINNTFINRMMNKLMLVLVMSLVLTSCATSSKYLEMAVHTGDFIQSTSKESSEAWPDSDDSVFTVTRDLSSGIAGKVLFFVHMYHATGSDKYLQLAAKGAYELKKHPYYSDQSAMAQWTESSYYYGRAGVAWILNEVAKITRDSVLAEAALRQVDTIHATIRGGSCSPFNDLLLGDAGTGLFLLYAYRNLKIPLSRALAETIANALLDSAVIDTAGMYWYFRKGRPFVLPNHSHGGGGIGYFLASLYEETRNPRYLYAAKEAARYLMAIAKRENGAFWVPYGWPNPAWSRRYDIGWAHGSAGTARLFHKLYRITGDEVYRDVVLACANSMAQSGFPGKPAEFLIDTVFQSDKRFGLAGAAEFLFDVADTYKKPKFRVLALSMTDYLVKRAEYDNGKMMWSVHQYAFMDNPGKKTRFTGLFYGAAGFGMLLLRAHDTVHRIPMGVRLLDDPF